MNIRNVLKISIGYISDKLFSSRIAYREYLNNKAIKDNKGKLTGNVVISNPQNISIGTNSYVNGGILAASPNATISIGNNTIISYDVHIRTDMHEHTSKSIPMKEQGLIEKSIEIGNDVWIGYGVQIMPGVKIADGCIVGAGAVLTHDTEAYSVYGGVPAKKIRNR